MGKRIIKKITINDLLIYFIFLLYVLLSNVFEVNSVISISNSIEIIFLYLPYYFIGKYLINSNINIDDIRVVSLIVLIINIIYYFKIISLESTISEDRMGFAYNMLPCIFIQIYYMLKNMNLFNFIIGVSSIIFIIFQGTRGPILLIGVFILLLMYKKIHTIKFLLISTVTICIFVGIINSSFFSVNLERTINYLEDRGISTRILVMIKDGEISDDNGRDEIKEIVGDAISEKPFFGYGLYGDRAVTKGKLTHYSDGIYAHSLIYEILCDFGLLIGIPILLFIIYGILKMYICCNFDNCLIISIIIFMGFMQLLLSNSFVKSSYFFMLIGILTSLKKSQFLLKNNM